MRAASVTRVLAFAAQALAHGYVYRITADNTVYPGWDVTIDPTLGHVPERIAFGGGSVDPIAHADAPDIACGTVHSPPAAIAEVRAGSDVTFHWSPWFYSHKGPITAWMASYEGNVAGVDVNELGFIKFAEDTVDEEGVWANVRMTDDTNGTWTATIPADIKPGSYVIRQEIIALHFAVATTENFTMVDIGPQLFPACYNFNVTGDGDSTPPGVKFPGAYDTAAPGLNWDLNSTEPYPTVGPDLYVSEYEVELEPKEKVIISPTGEGEEADAAYYDQQYELLKVLGDLVSYFDSIGG